VDDCNLQLFQSITTRCPAAADGVQAAGHVACAAHRVLHPSRFLGVLACAGCEQPERARAPLLPQPALHGLLLRVLRGAVPRAVPAALAGRARVAPAAAARAGAPGSVAGRWRPFQLQRPLHGYRSAPSPRLYLIGMHVRSLAAALALLASCCLNLLSCYPDGLSRPMSALLICMRSSARSA